MCEGSVRTKNGETPDQLAHEIDAKIKIEKMQKNLVSKPLEIRQRKNLRKLC